MSVHCLVCGRLLTNPVSVDRGIGPTCWRRIQLNYTLEDYPEEAEKTTPFLAWGRGEPCPVCGVNPPPNVDADWDAWTAWTIEHLKEHAEAEG